ncbi:NAD(P)H-dependent flavin oxidoreductase [Seohaeicola nanhaiensis]|uniref:Propionate 3-nitronate monooxygenase n=1 Tax=Seohaeicola nanhaiensis TaxID=1387282 RepID=A0ABV9KNW8_9RHOB
MSGAVEERVAAFCAAYDLQIPVLLAPMAGACPPALSAAVATAGGMGACGALLMGPEEIGEWATQVRSASNGAFQMNLWIPDPAPVRDAAREAELRAFLGGWGPEVPEAAGDARGQDFEAQCAAMLAAGPAVISSIMGVYPADFVARMKAAGIRWFATVTTVAEALEAEAAGADVIVAQGMEAGGHRGAFEAEEAARRLVGLFALLPAVADAVKVPVVATGGIADARGVAAALMLGASAVQIGTGLLRTPEAGIAPAWAEGLARARPEDTLATRAFSGRLGRALRTGYAEAAEAGPAPAPYPVQRGLTAPMRAAAGKEGRLEAMQAWAGQAAALAPAEPAGAVVKRLWDEARALLKIA